MSNYSAVVVKITNLRPHPNADRLVCTNIFGNNVIVGKGTGIFDKGLYFPLESQLGEEFAIKNDLIRRKDENGKPAGGMFDENRRVRCQKFRGEKSEGFWIPIDSLDVFRTGGWTASEATTDGQEIDEFYGKPISTKYIPRSNSSPGHGPKQGRKPRESRIIPGQFHFHFDTAQLGRNMHKIHPQDVIVLTWKLHGTSAIVSKALVKKSNKILKFLKWLGLPVEDKWYDYLYASRHVIKNSEHNINYYGSDIWTQIGYELFHDKLINGETVYYEIVGYTPDGRAIQGQWDYGCDPAALTGPQYKVFIYRITRTSTDGHVTELQWNQVRERATQLEVPTVPEIFYGEAGDYLVSSGPDHLIEDWRANFLAYLKTMYVFDQDSIFCKNPVPEEGIVLTTQGLNIESFKLKSFAFLGKETEQLDKGEVDMETQES